MKSNFFLGALFLCALGSTSSSEEKEVIFNKRLEESVVTASTLEENVKNTPRNLTIITKEDIAKTGAREVAKVLEGVPGVSVSTLAGSDPKFTLRGFSNVSTVKVLINGIPVNDLGLGSSQTSQVPIETVERIEIIPGGNAVLYGDNSVGGVINIITDSAANTEKFYGNVRAETGSHSAFKYGVSAGSQINDDINVGLDFSDFSAKGYRKHSDTDFTVMGLTSNYKVDQDQDLNLKYSWSQKFYNTPGSLSEAQVESDRTQAASKGDGKEINNSILLGYTNSINDSTLFNFRTGYRFRKLHTNSRLSENNNLTLNPEIKYSYSDSSYILGGLDYQSGESDVIWGSSAWTKLGVRSKDSLAGYLYNKSTIDKFELIQGYRFEKSEYGIDYSGTTTDMEKKFYNNGLELAANFLYSDTGNLFLNFNRAYRTPNTDEIGAWAGDFSPQISNNIELGIKDVIMGSFISTSVFTNKTQNEIDYFKDSNGISSNRNLDGDTYRKGLEILAEQYLGALTLKESYSFIDHEIQGGVYNGSEIPGVSNHMFSVAASYDISDALTANASVKYTGSQYANSDFDNLGIKEEAFSVADLGLKYTYNNLSLYGGINNLFNKKYNEYVGSYVSGKNLIKFYYPAAGRSYYAGFNYKF